MAVVPYLRQQAEDEMGAILLAASEPAEEPYLRPGRGHGEALPLVAVLLEAWSHGSVDMLKFLEMG